MELEYEKNKLFNRLGHSRGRDESPAVPSSPPLFQAPQFHPYQPSCSILGILFILFGKELQAGLQVAHKQVLVLQQMKISFRACTKASLEWRLVHIWP